MRDDGASDGAKIVLEDVRTFKRGARPRFSLTSNAVQNIILHDGFSRLHKDSAYVPMENSMK